jgi:hypothetical protein
LVCCHDDETSGDYSIWKGTLALKAGEKYKIEMEFCGERPQLLWMSKSQEPEIIPACQLYPNLNNIDDSSFLDETFTLQQIVCDCTHIYAAKIASVDRVKKRMSIRLIDPIKGKTDIKEIHYNLSQPRYDWHAAFALKDMAEGQQAILFFKHEGPGDMKSLLFYNGYFLQFIGAYDENNLDNIWIPFTQIQCGMNRTFAGSTIRLLSLLRKAVELKQPLPEPRPEIPILNLRTMLLRPFEPKIDFEDKAAVEKALKELPSEDK